MFDKNHDGARNLAAEIKGFASGVDIADYEGVGREIARFEQEVGPTDILVNNAGWDRFANFVDTTPELWEQLIAINLKGPLNMSHVVLKGMVGRGHGRIVNIASDAGRVGSSQEAVYSACKGGIIAFTKTVAREGRTQGHHAEHGLPRPDRYTPARRRRRRRRARPEGTRSTGRRHPDEARGPARGHSRCGLLSRQRRCGLHHRPDDQRVGRLDHARLSREHCRQCPELDWLVGAFPNFVCYVVTSFALTLLFTWIYTLITPWREFALIRAGNSAAAIALIGACWAFACRSPTRSPIRPASSISSCGAGVALVVQVLVHLGMRLTLPHLSNAIEADTMAAGITAGGFALSFGLINAACLTS